MLLIVKELLKINKYNIGLYIGSFDPVHNAHINIPLSILEDYKLSRVVYVPTGNSPIGKKIIASSIDRLEMLKNATNEHETLEVDDFECRSSNISYTIDTIKHFGKTLPKANLRLLIGKDNFESFTSWHRYEEILSMANIIVLNRDNTTNCDSINLIRNIIEENIILFNNTKSERIHFSDNQKLNISSSMIRSMIGSDKSIDQYVSDENNRYIKAKGLYV